MGKQKVFKKGKDMSGLKSKFVTPLYFMQQGQVQIMQYNQMGHTAT